MVKRIVILESAQEECKSIKKYVKEQSGEVVWNEVNAEYKSSLTFIGNNPHIGNYIEELKDIGIVNVRYILIQQTRMIYEMEDDVIIIHMFIATKRDFKTHLFKRLLISK